MVRERPPRLRLLRWLRSILLMAHPPLLRKEGNTFGEFIHSCFREKPALIDRRYSRRNLVAMLAKLDPAAKSPVHGDGVCQHEGHADDGDEEHDPQCLWA